jgi:hypothetical protein
MNEQPNTQAAPVVQPAAPAPKADKPVGTAAKKAAKRPSKPVVTDSKGKPKKAAPKAKAKKAKSSDGSKRTGLVNKQQRPAYVKQYRKDDKVKTAGGHVSVDCNDKVAAMLRGKELKDVYEQAAKVLKVSTQSLKGKYSHLNPGMQRMNLGNALRGAL